MSAADTWTSLPFTPLRSREHTSEAGSPTLEQVLLMSRSKSPLARSTDPGYGSLLTNYSSPKEGGLYASLLPFTPEEDTLDSFALSATKPSFAELMDMDSAVDEAYQNFLKLKQKQVAIQSVFGQGNNSLANKSSLDHGN